MNTSNRGSCVSPRNLQKPNSNCMCGCTKQRTPLTERNSRKSLSICDAKSPSVKSPCRCNSSYSSINFDDDHFWRTFKSVKKEVKLRNFTHKTVKRVVPVYKRNMKQNQSLSYPDLERSIFDGIPENRTVSKVECGQVVGMMGVLRFNREHNVSKSISDKIKIAIRRQNSNILPYGYLGKTNDALIPLRAAVINWLVKLQRFMVADPTVLFMAIRLFDKLLALQDVPESKYQLYGIITFWLALKYEKSANIITAPYLLKLCHDRFCVDYLLKTEKEVFDFLQSNLTFDDPKTFVEYYIQIFKNPNPADIRYAASYLLELLSLDNNFNSYAISLQASAALYFALRVLNYDDIYWYSLRNNPGYHSPDEFCGIYKILMEYILLCTRLEYWHRETYKKFTQDRFQNISLVIERKINEL